MKKFAPLGSVIQLPFDRQEEIANEFEHIFRSAWEDDAFDWPVIIKHFSDKYGPGKADAYLTGIMVGKQFAKDRTLSYVDKNL